MFKPEMVKAIIEGRKTQTRRVVKPDPKQYGWGWSTSDNLGNAYGPGSIKAAVDDDGIWRFYIPGVSVSGWKCPYGKPGDRLWVRERWGADNWDYIQEHKTDPWRGEPDRDKAEIHYFASEPPIFAADYWRSPIHMPRWASRITLEIASVRVQPVQDIGVGDCRAEGVYDRDGLDPARGAYWNKIIGRFQKTWDSINDKRPGCAWSDNPWVWVITFKPLEAA